MKKLLTSLLATCLLFVAFTGCSKQATIPDTTAPQTSSTTTNDAAFTSDPTESINAPTKPSAECDVLLVDYETGSAVFDQLTNGALLPLVTNCTIPFPSSQTISDDMIQPIQTAEQYQAYLEKRSDVIDVGDDVITVMTMTDFVYSHSWYENIAYSGQTKLCYFIVESPDFAPKHKIDTDGIIYDKTTDTVYIRLKTGDTFHDYTSLEGEAKADDIDAKTASTCALIVIDIDDFWNRQNKSNFPTVVVIKPEKAGVVE